MYLRVVTIIITMVFFLLCSKHLPTSIQCIFHVNKHASFDVRLLSHFENKKMKEFFYDDCQAMGYDSINKNFNFGQNIWKYEVIKY